MLVVFLPGLVSAAHVESSSDDLVTNTSDIQQPDPVNTRTGMSYNSIQDAIDSSFTVDGDTITCESGTYNEDVLVWKSLTIEGSGTSDTFVNSFYINSTGSGTCITGFTISGGTGDAVTLMDASECHIYNNIISCGYTGINMINSSYNEISANIINDSFTANQFGIHLENSDVNNICGNYIDSSLNTGIKLFSSDNNQINNNIINTCYIGVCLEETAYNLIQNNDVNYNSYYGIYILKSNYSRVTGNEVHNNSRYGIKVANSDHITINTCNISNNLDGVHLDDNSEIIISENVIYENSSDGISVGSSDNVKILENNIYNNVFGVYIWRTSDNVQVNFNSILDSTDINMYYTGTGNVDATLNWWGYNSAADVANQIDSSIGTGILNFEPWIILTLESSPLSIYRTVTITADLLHDSDGVFHNPTDEVVPYNEYAHFTTTLGRINDVEFVNGVATTILRQLNTYAIVEVYCMVSHETVSLFFEVNPLLNRFNNASNSSITSRVTTSQIIPISNIITGHTVNNKLTNLQLHNLIADWSVNPILQ